MARALPERKWSSSLMFLAAAVGSAVGISNIWKFTYVAGANGGGAFVLIYAGSLLLIALPALIAELMIGRRGGASVVRSLENLSRTEGIHPAWRLYGLVAVTGVFLALSFYSVIAGWTIDYFAQTAFNGLHPETVDDAGQELARMLADPGRMILFQIIFLTLTAATVAGGVHKGLERVLSWLTPGLFVLLLALLGYAIVTTDFGSGLRFLFVPDFSKLTPTIVLMAIGQAFFSLGVGIGVLMTLGAYMNRETDLVRSAVVIACADGGVALIAGMAIFPIVFSYGLSPAEGPGLIFATLPVAFGQMPGGSFFGPLFFLLMSFAALTSAITIMECVVAWLEDYTNIPRPRLSLMVGLGLWMVGLATVFSFNIWSGFYPLDFLPPLAEKTIFEILDYIVSNLLMPLGGIMVAVLAGWTFSRAAAFEEFGKNNRAFFPIWRGLVRYLVPGAIALVFIMNLI